MVEEWQLVRLGEVATTSQGGTPRKNEADYWNGQIPFLTGADLTEFRLSRKHARSFLTAEGLHSGQTVVCEPGALLLATRTRVGLAGLTTEIMGASQDITRLTPSDEVHSGYLCRYLLSVAASLQRKSRGTTIQGITKDELQSIAIPLPPLPEQRAIAKILDSIDHAIEVTDALVSATEQLRDSLLNNLLTRGLPGRHTQWKEVQGLGTIPTDWETSCLGDILESTTYGTNVSLGENGGVPVLRMKNLQNGKIDLSDTRRANLAGKELLSLDLVRGDILFNRTNSLDLVGKVGVVQSLPKLTSFASYLVRLRAKKELADPFWLAALMASDRCQSRIRRFATPGVSQANINPTALKTLIVPLPPLPEQQAIAAILESVDESIGKRKGTGEGLRKLKESASDALLTGRVRVPKSGR